MEHPKLLPGWTMPATPAGYDEPVVVEVIPFEPYRPDFVSWRRPGFASNDAAVPANALPTWPWQPGFKPTHDDWQSIGFFPFD
jgi:hypothetical protein